MDINDRKLFSSGTYFAKNASYSDKYSMPFSGQLGNPHQPSGFVFGTTGNAKFVNPNLTHYSLFGPTLQGAGSPLPIQSNSPSPTGSQNHFNALSGIGTQTSFGTVTFGTPFGTRGFSQTVCDSNASNRKISKLTSDIKQILQVKHSYMFVARVLVGRPGQGRPGMRKPPEDPADPKGRPFNSCVNYPDKPTIFVIFDSTQCYPEYLIEYVRLQ